MELQNGDIDFKKAVLKQIQKGKSLETIVKELKQEVSLNHISFICGDRITARNRIIRTDNFN